MPEKLYTPADIMKAMPNVLRLWYKPFKQLRAMVAVRHPGNAGRHLSKRDAIMLLSFGELGETSTDDSEAARITQIEGELREVKLQLAAANAGVKTAREDARVHEKLFQDTRRVRDAYQEKNDQLIGTLRQLMNL